jgi:Protein of unknown function (DUF2800)
VSLFSLSAAERVSKCAASAALPRVYSEGSHASRGKEIHAFLCAVLKGTPRDTALAAVPADLREFCAALPAPDAGTPELAFAWHSETGAVRVLGSDIGRDYQTDPAEIPGTADVVQLEPGACRVDDYKSGFLEVTPAAANLQLGALALCAARVSGASEVTVRIRKITESATFEDDSAVLDVFALAEVEKLLKETVRHVHTALRLVRAKAMPNVTEGEWCRWCPARLACPAKMGAIMALRAPEGVATQFGALLGEDATQAHALYERAEEAMKTIRGQLYGYARDNPIRLPDGQVFGPVTSTREEVDATVAWPVLAELGPEVAAAAVEASSSKAAIDRALVRFGLGEKKREVMGRLRDAGAFISKETTTVRKHKEKTP